MSHSTSKMFMNMVYTTIEHGDHEHRNWLKNKCVELEAALEQILARPGVRLADRHYISTEAVEEINVRPLWYDVDMLEDFPA